jgi:hypothetical protein
MPVASVALSLTVLRHTKMHLERTIVFGKEMGVAGANDETTGPCFY